MAQLSRPVTEWVEDQDNVITNEALDRQFPLIGAEPVANVQEKSEQVHVALLALTESESFDICCSTRRPNSMPPRGAALGFILIPVLGNKFCVGVGVEQKERNGPGYIKEATMKHVVNGRLLRCAKVQHNSKIWSRTHVRLIIYHMCGTREKMCVCVTLCAFDEVFCLHTPSRSRHSPVSVREICEEKNLHGLKE